MFTHFLLLATSALVYHTAVSEIGGSQDRNPLPADLERQNENRRRRPFDPQIDSDGAPPIPSDDRNLEHPLPAELFALPPEAQRQIRNRCQGRRCRGQQQGHSNRRGILKELRSKSLQKHRGRRRGKNKEEADALVENNFQKTFIAKKQYYDLLGISDVADPADDGLFAGDMLLNDAQLDSLIATTKEISNSLGSVTSTRRRRSSLFFEDPNFEIQFWSKMPIPYWVDTASGFNTTQRNTIRAALSEITNSTGRRITFQEVSSPLDDSPYIEYTASNSPGICGASFVGQQTNDNNVYLNFNCKGIYGTIMHETMHTLGVAHHHTRLDRGSWLTINWNNVDPSCLDSFALNDMNTFTTYGTPYSYGSIMHYTNMVCAVNTSIPTLTPKQTPPSGVVMGQRARLSQTDIDLLVRIYCCGSTKPRTCSCKDNSVYCGYNSNIGYCTDTRYKTWMTNNCAKSCGLCNCPPMG